MAYTVHGLRTIYDRTSGYCHLCQKKLAFSNYGKAGSRATWEVDHSRAQSNGGTHRLNNLFAACISCNRGKGAQTTRIVRTRNGYTKAPSSKSARRIAKRWNAVGGAVLGAIPGALFGPFGLALGALIGGKLGYDGNPDRN
jgi:hypothetical protein